MYVLFLTFNTCTLLGQLMLSASKEANEQSRTYIQVLLNFLAFDKFFCHICIYFLTVYNQNCVEKNHNGRKFSDVLVEVIIRKMCVNSASSIRHWWICPSEKKQSAVLMDMPAHHQKEQEQLQYQALVQPSVLSLLICPRRGVSYICNYIQSTNKEQKEV